MDPKKVVVAGDWHGNLVWARAMIEMLPELLPDEPEPLIVHLGDFGVWPEGGDYLTGVEKALEKVGGTLWFVDGNHEDHDELDYLRSNTTLREWPVRIEDHVYHLPRGHRWSWHGREWVAVGGAVSVDRALRRQNFDWWPQEEISEADQHRIVLPGHAEVMVCHDAPSTVEMRFGEWPRGWDRGDMERSDRHRDRLQHIVDEVRPLWLFHGHYHRHHDKMVTQTYGELRVVGLDMDGSVQNYAVIDVENMERVLPR